MTETTLPENEYQIDKSKIPTAMWFDDRFYKVKKDDEEYIIASVTTKLGIENKPFLYRWYAELGWDQARRRLNEAGERGKRIHYAWYIYLMGGVVLYNPWEAKNYSDDEIAKYTKDSNGLISILEEQSEMVSLWKLATFYNRVRPKIADLELNVFSVEDDIAGTLDNAFHIEAGKYDVSGSAGLVIPETGIYICDLKSGNQVSDSAWAQIAAYERAYISMGREKPKGGIVLHTSASTKKGILGFSAELKTSNELKFHYEIYQHLAAVWKARNPDAGPRAFEFPTIIKKGEYLK